MERILHAVFLIAGTAIGAGLVALPLTAVHMGLGIMTAVLVIAVFVTYRSSMMTIELNEANGGSASIVELSRKFSGEKAAWVSMASFYALSFALLTVYLSCIASTLESFLNISRNGVIVGSGAFLFLVLSLKNRFFTRLSTLLVASLLVMILACVSQFATNQTSLSFQASPTLNDWMILIPIVFTSFGVQNICANIYSHLNGNKKQIKKAFLLGICIPAIIYLVWIASVLGTALTRDASFFEQMRQNQVSVGELIAFLCSSSRSASTELLFQGLSLFAIITSAIGIGLGIQTSLQEVVPFSPLGVRALVCGLPAVVCFTVQNAFLKILSFGGMIAVVFVIFMPFYLKKRTKMKMGIEDFLCLSAGILVVLCEAIQLLR